MCALTQHTYVDENLQVTWIPAYSVEMERKMRTHQSLDVGRYWSYHGRNATKKTKCSTVQTFHTANLRPWIIQNHKNRMKSEIVNVTVF